MLFRLVNLSQGQISLNLIKKAEIPKETPNWRRKRLNAILSTVSYLIPKSEYAEVEFDSREECLSQPQINNFVSSGLLRVDVVLDSGLTEIYEVSEPNIELEEKAIEQILKVVEIPPVEKKKNPFKKKEKLIQPILDKEEPTND